MGSLSGFDRLVFRGILRRLFYPQGMDYCLAFWGVLLKDFAQYVLEVTARLKEASLASSPSTASATGTWQSFSMLRTRN
jgi:hypothetical protein